MANEQQGIVAPGLIDWLIFRRSFKLRTDRKPEIIEKRLANVSQPPPIDPTPFTASVSVAVTHTANNQGLFELHVMRGLPWGDHYSSMIATGTITEEADGGAVITGEIHPAQQGLTVYSSVIVLLLLWVAATVISEAVSPVVSFVPTLVAAAATILVGAVVMALYANDLNRIIAALDEVY